MVMDDIKKKSSRDAARQRRGQQKDEYSELALQIPLPGHVIEKLERLCIMRLSNSYIKIKHVLQEIKEDSCSSYKHHMKRGKDIFDTFLQKALGGFIFVLADDGQCLYISANVSEFLGLNQLELTGHSIYKYIHPCDHDLLAKQLGGHVPLGDMEIFDGLFCSDVHTPPKQVKAEFGNMAHRSFCLRMKSTLTSRGKSVNMNASIHRVVHCTGTMKLCRMKRGLSSGSITRCFIGIGIPLLCKTTFGVPLDTKTFLSRHSLDLTLISIDDIATDILGYSQSLLKDKSWYSLCNVCDLGVLETCHKTVLQQGQSISGYYRLMVQKGGWVWLQTKASMVYNSATNMPAYIMCVQYVISGVELKGQVLSSSQMPVVKERNDKRRSMDKPTNHDIASILPCASKKKTEWKSKTSGYKHDFRDHTSPSPSPCIPFPLHDAEISLCSLDDPTPPPILPGHIGSISDASTAILVASTGASTVSHGLEVKRSLKELSVPADSLVYSDAAPKVHSVRSPSPSVSDDASIFDDFLLADDYGNLEFGECSPMACNEVMEKTDCFPVLKELANASVSSLFLLHENICEGEESDLDGMMCSDGSDENNE